MSRLQDFLNQLSDWELVNFRKYRYDQFIKNSQQRIDDEIQKRNLNLEAVKFDGNDEPLSCPRCLSSKYYDSTEVETITYSYASVDLEVDVRTCLVCLYSGKTQETNSKEKLVGPVGFLSRLMNRKK